MRLQASARHDRRFAEWFLIALSFGFYLTFAISGNAQDVRTSFAPGVALGRVSADAGHEVSGIVASRKQPGVLWIHSDGPRTHIHAIATNGSMLASCKIAPGAADLEDIAIGPGPTAGDWLYLGDIGDNDSKRMTIRLQRFIEPVVPSHRGKKLHSLKPDEIQTIQLAYPDGPHNAEALLVDPISGDVFIATKEHKQSGIYRVTQDRMKSGSKIQMEWVCTFREGRISGGDISPDGREIALRRENAAWLWQRKEGQTIADALIRVPIPIPVIGPPAEPNGEAIGFCPDGSGYYTVSEGKEQPIYYFRRIRSGER